MFSNLYLYFFLSRFLSLMIFSISVSKSNQSISSYLGELFLFITSLYSFCSFFLEIVSIISTQKTSFIKFNKILSFITSKKVFVDPKNHGGGLHQGKKNSFLDMHLDFNYHPINKNWYRELNLLLYLNKDWKPEYKGGLKIRDLRTNEEAELDVPFNRLIIQQCAPYTLHGYDMTNFPEGNYRTSIATYAYQIHNRHLETPRTTDWFPKEDASFFKKQLAKNYNFLVQTKNKLFGSGTAKNQ